MRHKPWSKRKIHQAPIDSLYLLDSFSLNDVRRWTKFRDDLLDYQLVYYSYLDRRRGEIGPQLKEALISVCQQFTVKNWQRVVTYKYTLQPLSARGSTVNSPGGRFNIGEIDDTRFQKFAALYLACNRETAFVEQCGLPEDYQEQNLDSCDIILRQTNSLSIVCISGEIRDTLDITRLKNLDSFVNLISKFELPWELRKRAKELRLKEQPRLIKTASELQKTLLAPEWRALPQQFDVPANSQIFGKIAKEAGVQAILYNSHYTHKACLAVFPENFKGTNSFLELVGPLPTEAVDKRIDSDSCEKFV